MFALYCISSYCRDRCCRDLADDCLDQGLQPAGPDVFSAPSEWELPEERNVRITRQLLELGARPRAGLRSLSDGFVPSDGQLDLLMQFGYEPTDEFIEWLMWRREFSTLFARLLQRASDTVIRKCSGNCLAVHNEAVRRDLPDCLAYGDA